MRQSEWWRRLGVVNGCPPAVATKRHVSLEGVDADQPPLLAVAPTAGSFISTEIFVRHDSGFEVVMLSF